MFIRRGGFLLSDWMEDDWFVQLRELAVLTSVSSPMGDTVREALVAVGVFFFVLHLVVKNRRVLSEHETIKEGR